MPSAALFSIFIKVQFTQLHAEKHSNWSLLLLGFVRTLPHCTTLCRLCRDQGENKVQPKVGDYLNGNRKVWKSAAANRALKGRLAPKRKFFCWEKSKQKTAKNIHLFPPL